MDEKSYKSIFIYKIVYVTVKDLRHLTINSLKPLFLIFGEINGYFEQISGNKYMTPVPTNESNEIKNYGEL